MPRTVPDDAVIDVDGHVWEPDEIWTEHLDPTFRDGDNAARLLGPRLGAPVRSGS